MTLVLITLITAFSPDFLDLEHRTQVWYRIPPARCYFYDARSFGEVSAGTEIYCTAYHGNKITYFILHAPILIEVISVGSINDPDPGFAITQKSKFHIFKVLIEKICSIKSGIRINVKKCLWMGSYCQCRSNSGPKKGK